MNQEIQLYESVEIEQVNSIELEQARNELVIVMETVLESHNQGLCHCLVQADLSEGTLHFLRKIGIRFGKPTNTIIGTLYSFAWNPFEIFNKTSNDIPNQNRLKKH